MAALIGFILKLVSGGTLDRVLTHLRAREDTETERARIDASVAAEHIKAEIARREAQKDMAIAGMQSPVWWFAWALFVVPLGIWWAAVIADSLFHFAWNVAALPPPLDEWAAGIISALFLIGSGERIAGRILDRRG